MGMFSDDGDKTEKPTGRKLEDAFNQGQIARSEELQTVFVLVAGFMALSFTAHEIWLQLVAVMASTLGHLHEMPVTMVSVSGYTSQFVVLVAVLAGPTVVTVMFSGMLAGALQNRFRTTSEALQVKWERLNPAAGLARVFSMRSAVPTGLATIKLAIVVFLSYSVVQDILADPIFFTAVSAARIADFLAETSGKIILRVCGVVVFIAAADYAYQVWKTNKDLMMTKEEVKDEAKNSEQNPEVKSMRRRKMMALRKAKMMAELPKADVVVRNPTHFAVALRYDRKTMRAPRIIAKGTRLNALKIIEIAQKHQIPVVENKPLAQMMYKHGRMGGEIPAELYKAVAEVLAWVYRVNRYRYYMEENQVKN